jgi:hypothetical protein
VTGMPVHFATVSAMSSSSTSSFSICLPPVCRDDRRAFSASSRFSSSSRVP